MSVEWFSKKPSHYPLPIGNSHNYLSGMEPLATLGAVTPKGVDHGGDTRCAGSP